MYAVNILNIAWFVADQLHFGNHVLLKKTFVIFAIWHDMVEDVNFVFQPSFYVFNYRIEIMLSHIN